MSQRANQDYNELLSSPFFNSGLPRDIGSNTCYINSLVVSLRCLSSVLKLVIDHRLHDYELMFIGERDLLISFHGLVQQMATNNPGLNFALNKYRATFIGILHELSDRIVTNDPDSRPVPGGNAQGDPLQLLNYLNEWLLDSIYKIKQRAENISPDFDPRQRQILIAACGIADRLEHLIRYDITPMIATQTRCPRNHTSERVGNEIIMLSLPRQFERIENAIDFYFAKEQVEVRCDYCNSTTATKGCRMDELPKKVLVFGIKYASTADNQVCCRLLSMMILFLIIFSIYYLIVKANQSCSITKTLRDN